MGLISLSIYIGDDDILNSSTTLIGRWNSDMLWSISRTIIIHLFTNIMKLCSQLFTRIYLLPELRTWSVFLIRYGVIIEPVMNPTALAENNQESVPTLTSRYTAREGRVGPWIDRNKPWIYDKLYPWSLVFLWCDVGCRL